MLGHEGQIESEEGVNIGQNTKTVMQYEEIAHMDKAWKRIVYEGKIGNYAPCHMKIGSYPYFFRVNTSEPDTIVTSSL